ACAKKPGAKKAHPAYAPDAARRVRGAGGIFGRAILALPKTPHIHVRRPAGLVRRLHRFGGAPEKRSKGNRNGKSLTRASRRVARVSEAHPGSGNQTPGCASLTRATSPVRSSRPSVGRMRQCPRRSRPDSRVTRKGAEESPGSTG